MAENPVDSSGTVQIDFEMQPLDVRLDPENPNGLHDKLIAQLKNIIFDARKHIAQRFDDWDLIDKHNRLYVDLSMSARKGDKTFDKNKKEMPFERSIAVPLTYHIIQTRMATEFNILTSTDPFAHLESYSSDGFKKARLMEARLNKDCRDTHNTMEVWQALYDVERYGICMWKLGWWEETELKSAMDIFSPEEIMMRGIDPMEPIEEVSRQGNRWETVDPRNMILDPAVPSAQWWKMEYIGDVSYVSWLELDAARLERKQGPYINVDKARERARQEYNRRNTDGRWMEGTYGYKSKDPYPLLEMANIQWRLIPSEYGLSPSSEQEIWQFAVVNEHTVVRAHKLEQSKGKIFTYFTAQGDPDRHSLFVPGIGQQLIGVQLLQNWLVNSHVTNARKSVNDQIIYNDDLINKSDLSSPRPMRHIRLTREGKALHKSGRMPIGQMYGQLQLTNITGQHLETSRYLLQDAQRMAATPDTMQGMPLPTKRTLGEIENVSNAASMRIGTTAQLLDEQLIQPCMLAAVRNIQDFADMEDLVLLTGRLVEQLGGTLGMPIQNNMVPIRGADLSGDYEYIIRTPTMAKDPARQAATWSGIMQILSTAPQLMNPMPDGRALNPHAIFNELVRSMGVDYFDQFYFNTMPAPAGMPAPSPSGPVPPETLEQNIQSGRMAPLEEVLA